MSKRKKCDDAPNGDNCAPQPHDGSPQALNGAPQSHDDAPKADSEGLGDAQGEAAVGYGHPPVEHQYKKGVSGNPRGRPHKVERSLIPRQLRRDILRVFETPTSIRTEKGKRKLSIIEAIVLRTASKALAGHGPSIRLSMKTYADALDGHYDAHAEKFHLLEDAERILVLHPEEGKSEWARAYLNGMRKLTRRT